MEPAINVETLTFMLTTATEERPMHERMTTLTRSREWLMKELKSMREQDRKLARQFIQMRSAIVQLREYCENEDSGCESEFEGTAETLDNALKTKNKKKELSEERKMHIRDTSINMLTYC